MKIAIDTHTHSLASGHAYSTVDEMARGARRRGLKGFVLTDHGPGISGGIQPHPYHFGNLPIIPERIRGIRFLKGVEANILDLEGSLDMAERQLARLDFVLAGLHEACFAPRGTEENTAALVRALGHPHVDAVSHAGNPVYPIDARTVILAARDNGKAIEINNSSFRVRPGSHERCREIALLCMETGTPVVCGSDAHFWTDVGRFDKVMELFREIRMPAELVINSSERSFDSFLARRRADRAPAT
ncbi:MAG TPA: phosphatase [Rectinemataceae bacterium]|nr:phosphatase [Rectinemataceae bacterium]